jgi:hypothetical protein
MPPIPWRQDAIMAGLAPVDLAFRQMETKWGVGRLECLVSPPTLESYRRGWVQWRQAIIDQSVAAVQHVGPKMVAALKYMDAEATKAGHRPLAVETWEARMEDGRVLVVVKTMAEGSAIARAAGLGLDANLPPDLTRVVQHQHDGRELVVWSMAELARVLPSLELVDTIKRTWPGATVTRGPVTREGDHADWASGDEVRAAIEGV